MEQDIFANDITLSIETRYKVRLPTRVLGWKRNAFIMTDVVYEQGHPANLKPKDTCTIRFLKNGVAYGFEAEVLSILFFPFPLMFFAYPSDVACVKLRVAPRYKTDLPATLLDAAGAVIAQDAVVLDISEGGCRVQVPLKEGREFLPDAAYTLRIKIMDKEISSSSGIRSMDKRPEANILGMDFPSLTQQNKDTLALFLDFLKKHANAL